MSMSLALAALTLSAGVYGQQAGTLTAETHPKMSIQKCSTGGTCVTEQHTVVLDANWRWLHSTSGATNCYSGNTWDATLCPDPTTCAANCALDGGDYAGTYGISASGNSLSMKLVTGSGSTANVGSRVYLMDTADSKYQMFNLLNQEFTVDIDVSGLPCGLNGALYFVSMDADGGQSKFPTNKAGAKYGTGYCDAQCPQDIKFINGKANIGPWTPSSNSANTGSGPNGACCSEMDIWEANSISTAYTPHPCTPIGYAQCSSAAECGLGDERDSGFCDKSGCDFNSYRQGNTSFYGPGKTIDTTKKLTAVTQFITSDGTANGDLIEIKRIYVQGGVVYQNSYSDVAGITGNSITEGYCDSQKVVFQDSNTFKARGGLKAMGQAFANGGMVLVMSIWDDYAVNMLWLDAPFPTDLPTTNPGVVRGTCSVDSGKPADVEKNSPGATVIYSNIKVGPLGSTFSGIAAPGGNPGSGSSSSSSKPVSSSTTTRPVSSSTTTKPVTTTTTSKPVTTTTTKPVTTTVATTTKPVTTTTTTKPATSSSAAPAASCAAKYGQCGGDASFKGPTCCQAGSTCKFSNAYYSQCL